MMRRGRVWWVALLVSAVLTAVQFALLPPVAVGGADRGALSLANATALLRGEPLPVTQRPPLPGVIYTGLAVLLAVNSDDTVGLAQELGSVDRFPVALALTEAPFLQSAGVLNAGLRIGVLLLLWALLRLCGVSPRFALLALLLTTLLPTWTTLALVDDFLLTALLLAGGVVAVAWSAQHGWAWMPLVIAGGCFALSALSRPTYQLWNPLLALLLVVLTWGHWSGMVRGGIALMGPWLLLVVPLALVNAQQHGFLGLSSVTGVALGTRTVDILPAAASAYPDDVPVFVDMRNERFIAGDEVIYWGADATRWLMRERDLTYSQANQYLAQINLTAIQREPFRYVETVILSFVKFNFSGLGWSANLRVLLIAELLVILTFVALSLLWAAFRVLMWVSPGVERRKWQPTATVLVVLLGLYLYTGVVSAAVDIGSVFQRYPVDFVIPAVIVLSLGQLRFPPDTNVTAEH